MLLGGLRLLKRRISVDHQSQSLAPGQRGYETVVVRHGALQFASLVQDWTTLLVEDNLRLLNIPFLPELVRYEDVVASVNNNNKAKGGRSNKQKVIVVAPG
jgi:hypothetical protein